jgi:Flp pilus assembly pilin Flp
MWGVLKAFTADDHGAALIEYSLVTALVAIAILAALADLGAALGAIYETIRLGLASPGASS